MNHPRRPRQRQIREIIAAACGLLHARSDVRSVHVVGAMRPTYRQLLRYRKVGQDDQADLIVDGDGAITIRQKAQ